MEKSYSESYAAAGVDITAGYRSVELMKQYVARTMNEHCIGGLGGFGGLFELDCTGYKHPVLISPKVLRASCRTDWRKGVPAKSFPLSTTSILPLYPYSR